MVTFHAINDLDPRNWDAAKRSLRFRGLWSLLLILIIQSPFSWGADIQPVESGKEALRSLGSVPWYDADADDLRPPTALQRNEDDQGRFSTWLQRERAPKSKSQWIWNWPNFIGLSIAEILGWTFLVVALFAIIALLIYFFWKAENPFARGGTKEGKKNFVVDQRRLSDLPFDVAPMRHDLWDEIQACVARKDYQRAIIYLYSYQLLKLDVHRMITLQRGKTNRMYLREIRNYAVTRKIVEKTMLAFEEVYFGLHALSERQFMECFKMMPDFEKSLAEPAPVESPVPNLAPA